MRRARHVKGERDGGEDADRQGNVTDGILPIALLTVDGAEREPSHRQRYDR